MVNCRFLGNACIELIGESDHIIIDPTFITAPMKGIQKVFVTHQHKDHIEEVKLQKIRESYINQELELEIYGPECIIEEFNIEFILIIPGTKIALNNGDIKVYQNNCWKAEGCIAYFISIDNKNILHTADSAKFSEELLAIKDQIDLCFVACFPDNYQDYLKFLKIAMPKLVIPYHFTPEKRENAMNLVQFLRDNGLKSNFLSIGQEIKL